MGPDNFKGGLDDKVDVLIDIVCKNFEQDRALVTSGRRYAKVQPCKMAIVYILYCDFCLTMQAICEYLNMRNHTSILAQFNKALAEMSKKNSRFAVQIWKIRQELSTKRHK